MTTLKVDQRERVVKALLKAQFPLAALYSFVLPFPNNLKTLVLILLGLIWIAEFFATKKLSYTRSNQKILLLLFLYYLLCLLSIFNSEDKADAWAFFVLQTTIPLLPLFLIGKLNESEVKKVLHFFIAGLIAVSVLAFYRTYVDHFHSFPLTISNLMALDWSYFSFTLPISVNFHAPYFSLYACAALLLIVSFLFNSYKQKNWALGFLYFLLAVYTFTFIALLSSRTALFSILLIITVFFGYRLIATKRFFLLLAFLMTIGSVSFIVLQKVPYLNNKIANMDGHQERLLIWTSGLNVIVENLIFGVGTGDRKAELKQAYEKKSFVKGVEQVFNLHNQYLETTLALGILGLSLFLLILIHIIKFAFQKNHYLLLAFVLLFLLCCTTESLLQRQAGVVLFSYFISIFVFWEEPEARS